jgi:hypothetical protein
MKITSFAHSDPRSESQTCAKAYGTRAAIAGVSLNAGSTHAGGAGARFVALVGRIRAH